ncbi:T9SS type A sorting domain-containing protein [Taibaiella soli]|uniref:Secretion system C-terminal sorting domain-containing protein n=1 Tax=Taibaiella soli TaxID=1649169 RepID=A0A2W2AHZ1_9BACT|nr:T9SS type A sorting domain-containing protein [Taibaiella soli]PZF73172.1 hypothetical protein DN068_09890 [Taibaiella soli]
MKKLLFFLFLLPLLSKAQINILPQTGVQHILPNVFQEYGGAYYFLSYDTSLAAQDIYYDHPHQYLLHKVNKYTNAEIGVTIAAGDTLQVDSLVNLQSLMKISSDGHIYLFYHKFIAQNFNLPQYQQFKCCIYCTVFDTSLQQIVSDKRLVMTDGTEQFFNPALQELAFVGNKPVVTYTLYDTLQYDGITMSKFMELDGQVNILRHDTLGDKTAVVVTSPGEHYVANLCTSKNRIAVWGEGFLPVGPFAQDYSITVLDTTFSVIDTFRSGDFNGLPNVFSYWEANTTSMLLPSGTLIQGHCAYNTPVNHYTVQSVISRRSLDYPFQIDKYLIVSGKDSLDKYHGGQFPGWQTITYNAFDGNIYYANNTHSDYLENTCLTPDNYLQIICADTNLNHKWTKYIYSGSNSCSFVNYVVSAYQRSGIVLCGVNSVRWDPLAYYIDSTGSLGVSNTTQPVIRDRFNVYPNPATSKVFVDDVFDKLKSATVYAMDGSVVINQSLTSGKNELNVALLPPGLYLIRLMSKDDEVYQTKFVKDR